MKEIVISVRTLGTEEANKQIGRLNKGLSATAEDADDAANSISKLEQELGEMQDTLKSLDTNSDEFADLSREVSKADAELQNLNAGFAGMNADAVAGEVGKLVGGLGSLATAAGVAAVGLGASEEKTEEMIQTFAIGLSATQGIQGAIDVYTSSTKLLKDQQILQNIATKAAGIAQAAYTLAVGTSTGAMKLFRLALVATGIGAIVVGIGLLVANFDAVSEAVGKAVKWFRDLGPVMKTILYPVTLAIAAFDALVYVLQELGVIDDEETVANLENAQKRVDAAEAEEKAIEKKYKREIALIDETKTSLAELEKEKNKALEAAALRTLEELKGLLRLKAANEDSYEEETELIKKKIEQINILRIAQKRAIIDKRNDEKEAREDAIKDAGDEEKDKQKAIEEARQEAIVNEQARLDEQFQIESELRLSAQELEIQQLNQQYDKKFEIIEGNDELERELFEEQQRQIAEIDQRYKDEKLEREREAFMSQLELETELRELSNAGIDENSSISEIEAYYSERAAVEEERAELVRMALVNELENKSITESVFDAKSAVNEKKLVNKKKQLAKEESDYKNRLKQLEVQNAMNAAGSILGSIASMASEGSAIAKAAAVGQATMDTYKGAVAAYAAGSSVGGPAGLILGPLAAGLAVAAGVLNVKKILQTKTPGNTPVSTGGLPTSTPSSTVTATEEFNPGALYSSQSTDFGPESIGSGAGQRQEPIRAYVVETEITATQNEINTIEQRSEIG